MHSNRYAASLKRFPQCPRAPTDHAAGPYLHGQPESAIRSWPVIPAVIVLPQAMDCAQLRFSSPCQRLVVLD